jgi:hypothetical protein
MPESDAVEIPARRTNRFDVGDTLEHDGAGVAPDEPGVRPLDDVERNVKRVLRRVRGRVRSRGGGCLFVSGGSRS